MLPPELRDILNNVNALKSTAPNTCIFLHLLYQELLEQITKC